MAVCRLIAPSFRIRRRFTAWHGTTVAKHADDARMCLGCGTAKLTKAMPEKGLAELKRNCQGQRLLRGHCS